MKKAVSILICVVMLFSLVSAGYAENEPENRLINLFTPENFSFMFNECESLNDIKPLEKWNVSNGTNFSGMFIGCSSLNDIKPLENWKLSENNFKSML